MWTKFRPQINKKYDLKSPSKKQLKLIPFKAENPCSQSWTYSKNDGGLFKITLFLDSQRYWKTSLELFILERFSEPKSTPDREKLASKSSSKVFHFLIRFYIDFVSNLDPQTEPKIVYFLSVSALVVSPAPFWRQECSKSAPRQAQRSIFEHVRLSFGRFWSKWWQFRT